ncbi:hypothetical protein R6Q59_002909 [Mikania micrantha]|uniref:RRM domain-containing protein n=1 Tax=Mikania micrantha TaxID=192012 RepID=A0A5N6NPI7_9ASTR|nr:hypothetical protein E3N88_19908 [Mikania micrantha]
MADAVFHRFPNSLDPTAQEFRPTYLYYSFLSPPTLIIPVPSPPPAFIVPTRALLLSSVPTNASESTVRRELEVFGDVRAVQMERLRDGIVTVHFYDIRHAVEALNIIQEQHMQQQFRIRRRFDGLSVSPAPLPARGLLSGRVIWAQFAFPIAAGLPDRYNQGTVVITLDSNVSIDAIRDVFAAFGAVKEIRGTPSEKNKKYVEFYDTRDATRAVAALNGKEINGKPVVVEFNRPGEHKLNYVQSELISGALYSRPPPPRKKDSLVEYGVAREVDNLAPSCSGGQKKNVQSSTGGNGCRNKPWKGPRYRHRGRCDPRFLIKDEAFFSSFQDSRTTVMIKNIPNKYSKKLLLNMLDNHCIQCNEGDDQPLSSYDFVYLPIDFVNKCNVGYGFVNLTSPEAAWRFYKAFNHQNWEVFNSKKICEVSYARLQGIEALKEHFKNSKFPCETEDYMPMVFMPPRDGRTLTEPVPIVGRCTVAITITSSSSSSSSSMSEDARPSSYSNSNDSLPVEETQSDAALSSRGGDCDNDGDM